jgi:outer membrane protein, heavy metal efflux system
VTGGGHVVLALVLVVGAPAARGEPLAGLPAEVTIDEVLRLVRERGPRVAATAAQVEVVAAGRVAAEALPNPSLSYSGLRLAAGANTGSSRQDQFLLEQPLLIFGQRGARRAAAERDLEAEQARVDATFAERAALARQAFATLLARQAAAGYLLDSEVELRRIEGIVRGRAAAGDRSRYDVLRVELEARALSGQVVKVRAEIEDAAGALATLVGAPGWRPTARGELHALDISTDAAQLWEMARTRRRSLRAAQRRIAAAQAQLTLARRERLPIPTLGAGALLTEDRASTSVVFGLSLPLPLFDRGQGALARSRAAIDAETLALVAEEAEVRAEIARSAAVLAERRKAVQSFDTDVSGLIPVLRQMAEDAYREGRGGIVELLDAVRTVRDMRLAYVEHLEALKLAEAATIAAAGLDQS